MASPTRSSVGNFVPLPVTVAEDVLVVIVPVFVEPSQVEERFQAVDAREVIAPDAHPA